MHEKVEKVEEDFLQRSKKTIERDVNKKQNRRDVTRWANKTLGG